MKVDFCLPIRNEAKVLEVNILKVIAYLEGLNLDYDWKIVGVVNGSNDDSFDVLCKLKENLPNKIDCLNINATIINKINVNNVTIEYFCILFFNELIIF